MLGHGFQEGGEGQRLDQERPDAEHSGNGGAAIDSRQGVHVRSKDEGNHAREGQRRTREVMENLLRLSGSMVATTCRAAS